MERPLAWQAGLLVPLPFLSVAYLLAIRAERLTPTFVPLLVLAALPVAAAVVGARGLRIASPAARRWHWALLAIAGVELLWAVLAQAMVGFAIAWRSG